ncbi:hypothetical protein [Pseudoramibacter faecis]|uniref:hypothetical protein n=1 Tax=Pseudoramibacter faecis TaxID=3108534 RepID=UPI002E781B69|nr:hypothetical protein [Pseudoramibacter sp. HA2172]
MTDESKRRCGSVHRKDGAGAGLRSTSYWIQAAISGTRQDGEAEGFAIAESMTHEKEKRLSAFEDHHRGEKWKLKKAQEELRKILNI